MLDNPLGSRSVQHACFTSIWHLPRHRKVCTLEFGTRQKILWHTVWSTSWESFFNVCRCSTKGCTHRIATQTRTYARRPCDHGYKLASNNKSSSSSNIIASSFCYIYQISRRSRITMTVFHEDRELLQDYSRTIEKNFRSISRRSRITPRVFPKDRESL